MERCRLVKIGTTEKQRKLFFRLNKEKRQLWAQGVEPEPQHLAERIGVSEKDVTDMDQRLNKPELSLDASIKEDSDEALIGFIPSDKEPADTEVAKKQMAEFIRRGLIDFKQDCDERELGILENRLMAESPLSLQQIGYRYGISRERVRQIQTSLVTKLRTYFEREIPNFASFRCEFA
jgi:RNA polymerase sigma-32 factor